MKLFLAGCLVGMFATFFLIGLADIFREIKRKRHQYIPQDWRKVSTDKSTKAEQLRNLNDIYNERVTQANSLHVSGANLKSA